jgi:hypothetical protein
VTREQPEQLLAVVVAEQHRLSYEAGL